MRSRWACFNFPCRPRSDACRAVEPSLLVHLVGAWLKGKPEVAQKLHRKWYPFFKALFVESNPVPTKAILAWQGKMTPDVRLPLVQMTENNTSGLRAIAAEYGLI